MTISALMGPRRGPVPDFCGKNLDALYDALTAETAVPTRLVVCLRFGEQPLPIAEAVAAYGAPRRVDLHAAAAPAQVPGLVFGDVVAGQMVVEMNFSRCI